MFRILQHYLILPDQLQHQCPILTFTILFHAFPSPEVSSLFTVSSLRDFYAQLPANGPDFSSGTSSASSSPHRRIAIREFSDCQRPRCIFHLAVNATTHPHQQQNIKYTWANHEGSHTTLCNQLKLFHKLTSKKLYF